MTKIDIYSGFLGAGKTTLIKKLISEGYCGEKIVLIENEFGEIGVDGGFLKDAGVEITEMNSGCICCSLVGDFGEALKKVLQDFAPDRIIIEPSGVGKLSDVKKAALAATGDDVLLGGLTTVVDANKCRMYMKNFGEFFNDQIENAHTVILSHTDTAGAEKVQQCTELIREKNPHATIITTAWDKLCGSDILKTIDKTNTLEAELEALRHHEHHHHHDEECDCGCHEHHHHHDEECDCGCHEHHHHDEECDCGCHEHHHHHADDVFSSWGRETPVIFSKEKLEEILEALEDSSIYGTVLRAKGFVAGDKDNWYYFDYIPGEADIREGGAAVTGRICVIGSSLDEDKLSELFGR